MGSKSMRIRRAGLVVALMLLMAAALAGVAWAANVIQCAPGSDALRPCMGTGKNDVLFGTNKADVIGGGHRGADTLYGRGGEDELVGGVGPDTIHGGPGDDYITNGDSDYWFGEDENHGGRANDHIVGNLMSEEHYGGRGSDTLVDYKSGKRPDTFRCGPGLDYVYYNKGLDKVTGDCEKLWAARPINVTPY
jgi:RTX calcium-binding nonapeptide repeat (4 copies)